MNPYAQIAKIMRKIKDEDFSLEVLTFSDGTEMEISGERIADMFDSVTDSREPNQDALYLLNKLDQGVEDDGGLCHLLKAMSTDPAELWSGEE